MKLEKKVALVTGAASGIGKAIAEQFEKEGAAVVASDIVTDALNDVVSGINAAGGNAICPGGVDTNVAVGVDFHELGLCRMGLGVPTMPRTGQPEEIARVAVMIVSDDASFLNGAAIPVDAGWSAY